MGWRGAGLAAALWLAPAAIAAGDPAPSPAVGDICSAERDAAPPGAERRLVMAPGLGTGGFPIATSKPEAQAWFDHGMKLAHAFYHEDAKLAFRRAREIDPDCAMCAWGEAWADGPTINFDVDAATRRAAGEIVARAEALAGRESARNRGLIAALKTRYVGAGPAADLAFARAMDALASLYPGDDEIAILTADAWLIPSQLRDDRQGVARAVALLEGVLSRHPDNTGAIHFYIHATEIAGYPARALPYADRLGALAPGASHLVHMASHTFLRVGRYEDAARVNARAIAVDGDYLRAAHDGAIQGKVPYHAHNVRFGLAGAMASGDAPLALRLAEHAAFAFPPAMADDAAGQMSLGAAQMAYGRFAPDRALAEPAPPPGAAASSGVYVDALRHYARGEAFAARGDIRGVRTEADRLRGEVDAADHTKDRMKGAARAVVRIAELTLRGRAAMLAGDPKGAAGFYQAAATIQDAELSYRGAYDPPPWWYPERRSLAAALLAAGQPARAEAAARAALAVWPHEPLTLRVLGEAETAAGETTAGERDLAEARRAWLGPPVSAARL